MLQRGRGEDAVEIPCELFLVLIADQECIERRFVRGPVGIADGRLDSFVEGFYVYPGCRGLLLGLGVCGRRRERCRPQRRSRRHIDVVWSDRGHDV